MSPDDDPLIRDVQKYLAQRVRGTVPDSLLALSWDHFAPVYDQLIRGFLRGCKVSPRDMDDYVQEVWLALLEKLGRRSVGPRGSGGRAWLNEVIRNLAIDIVCRRRNVALESLRDKDARALPAPGLADPRDQWEQLWNDQLVHVALAVLEQRSPPESYQIFFLRRIEDRSVAELAKRFTLPKRSIRERTERMERKFIALLKLYAGQVLG